MKHHLTFLALGLALVGCINNPYVKIENPDGTTTTFSTGRNLGSEVDEQVSEVEGPGGIHLRHMVKRQDASRVWLSLIRTAGTLGVAGFSYLSALEQQITDRMLAGEITKREGQKLLAALESERIALAATGATVVNPNLPIPLRK